MLYFIHGIVGAVFGSYFSNIWVIILLGILSHFILDMVPHWDGVFDKKLFAKKGKLSVSRKMLYTRIIDGLFTICLVVYFASNKLVLIGILTSLIPDLIKIFYFTPLRRSKIYLGYLKFHSKIQKEVDWKLGLLTQAIVLVLALILLILF